MGAKKWARDAQRWFKVAERTTQVLFHARGGGRLDWGLAAIGVAGMALEHFLGDDRDAYDLVRAEGLVLHEQALDEFLCGLLREHPRADRHVGAVHTLYRWRASDGAAIGAAIYRDAEHQDGPYLRPGMVDAFAELVRDAAWARGSRLLLSARSRSHHYVRAMEFSLDPLPPAGPFVGRHEASFYADRIRRYGPGARTVLIRGASGVGKSVLAQHIAAELAGPDARVLKIPATASLGVNPNEFTELIGYLRPDVLLLDDIDVQGDVQGWLAQLETLRGAGVLTIATQMTDATSDGPGDWYVPGMRPGRIDEVFALPLPDEAERRAIVEHYVAQIGVTGVSDGDVTALAAATDGLTGAWLGELVRRIAAHGWYRWEREVLELRRCVPVARPDREDCPF